MKKILIIDDESDVAEAMADFLKGKGYSVTTSTDPISAFWIYSEYQPDLVICDVNMPKMDGLEVLSKLRNTVPDLPLIMVTGAFLDQTGFNILKKYNVPQIIKPPDFENELLEVVEKKLNGDV